MTHSTAQMTEDSLSDLVKAGFTVDVKIYGFGAEATFSVSIKKDNPAYGPGLEIRAEGKGADGAAALRGAVATAETFLYAVPPRQRPKPSAFVTEAPLGGRTASEAQHDDGLWIDALKPPVADGPTDADPLRLANREKHRDAAQAGDLVREREDTAALSPF